MTRSDHVLIPRTGQPALRLDGYGLCAQATSRAQEGPRAARWHELELWSDDRAPSGPEQAHCIAVRYVTQWKGELGHSHAFLVPRRGIGDAVRTYQPMAHIAPMAGGQSEDRRRQLMHDLIVGYDHAVSALLEQARVWELADDDRP